MRNISNFMEVAEYLDDKQNYIMLLNLQEMLQNNKLCLSFLGQFSSGKSKLINNLLGRDILPVKVTETTASVTFIKYSEEESAILMKIDGSRETIALQELKSIYQNSDQIDAKIFLNLEYIEVYLKNELLKDGLILVDTPGVNTLNQRHEQLTATALATTGKAVYVMGKSLSNTDQNFLTDLKAGGIDCIYVRTRMDEIKSSDEKVSDTVKNDQKQLKELIEADPVIFHISNESGNDWYHEIDQLRAYLLNSFIGKLKDQNEIMVDKRLLLLAEVYQKRLESLKNSARTCLEGQTAEIDRQKCELSRLKEELNNRVQEKDRNLRKKIRSVKEKIQEETKLLDEQSAKNFRVKVNSMELSSSNEAFHKLMLEEMNCLAREIQNLYLNELDDLVNEETDEFTYKIKESGLADYISTEDIVYPDFTAFYEQQSMLEVYQQQFLEESSCKIGEIERNLSLAKEMYEKYEVICKDQRNNAQSARAELEALGPYRPQLVLSENQPVPVSEVMRKIGSVVDIATLLIPGSVYEKAIVEGAKGIGVAQKAAKAVQEAATAVKKGDKIKDGIYIVKSVVEKASRQGGTRATQKRKQIVSDGISKGKEAARVLGILDLLTFEHLFQKIGEKFDQPPVYEYDVEYGRQFSEAQKQLKDKYSQEAQNEIEKKQRLGLIKTEIEKQQELLKIEQRRAKEFEREQSEKKILIEAKLKKEYFDKAAHFYLAAFRAKINALSSCILDSYNHMIDEMLPRIIGVYTKQFCEEIDKVSLSLKQIEADMAAGGSTLKETMEICSRYQSYLLPGDKNEP